VKVRLDRRVGERSLHRPIRHPTVRRSMTGRRSLQAVIVGAVLIVTACAGTSTGAVDATTGTPQRGSPAAGRSSGVPTASPSVAPSAAFEPPATAVSLRLWNAFTGADADAFSSIVSEFNAAYPTVHVTVEAQPAAELEVRLQAAAAKHAMPHLVILDDSLIVPSAIARVIQPLDEVATKVNPFVDDPDSDIWSGVQWGGHRYAIPIDVHPQALFWNKSLFRSAGLDPDNEPKDLGGLESAIKTVVNKTGVPGFMLVASGREASIVEGELFATLFAQGGGAWTSQDLSQATYNSPAGVQAAEYLAHLVHDLKVPLVDSGADVAAFRHGDNAMFIGGTWEIAANSDALARDLGVAVVPTIFGPGVWAGSHNAAVTAGVSGDELLGAEVFIEWLVGHSLELANAGEMPTATAVRDQLGASGSGIQPLMARLAPEIDAVQLLPSVPGGHDLAFGPTGAGDAVVQVITGKADAASALGASARSSTAILEAS